MRALVISDTHFGAWTGRDLLREEFFLERLAPDLEDVDELIFLGDLFDFLFGAVDEAVDAADGLLRLIAEKMAGERSSSSPATTTTTSSTATRRTGWRRSWRAATGAAVDRPARASSSDFLERGCPGSRSRSPTRPTASATSSAPTATTSTRTPASAARAATAC